MALLVLLREAWSARREAHIRFLKLQVEILQSRAPGNRIIPDPVERRKLLKAGAAAGHAVEHILGVVSIKTYRRWLREQRGERQPGKVGLEIKSKDLELPTGPYSVVHAAFSACGTQNADLCTGR